MILYHATPKANLDSIQQHGLNPDFSKGAEKVIWLHTASRREWAILHTQRRHNLQLSEVLVLRVDVPRSKLKRRWRGLWTTASMNSRRRGSSATGDGKSQSLLCYTRAVNPIGSTGNGSLCHPAKTLSL